MGRPSSYNGRSFNWNNGKLKSITKGSVKDWSLPYEAYTYTYNAKGQRTSKTYFYRPPDNLSLIGNYLRNTNIGYTYDNSGRLIREKRTLTYSDFSSLAIEFIYLYDESGIIGVQFTYGDEAPQLFYYQRNLQGDVVAIYNTSGVLQAAYSYNTWGNCTVANSTNARIANYNPIRYRGYYLDSETNWYFLNARYYSPEWRRFISPDDTAYLVPQYVNGCNLYAYCNNDPINFVDPSGHDWNNFWKSVWDVLVEIYMRALSVQTTNQTAQNVVTQTITDRTKKAVIAVADMNLQANASRAQIESQKSQISIQIVIGINDGIEHIVDEITKGAPGYATDVYLLPQSSFSSGVGPGASGVQHAGDLIFSRFFGQDYVMDTIN